jgi:hypothetical protein
MLEKMELYKESVSEEVSHVCVCDVTENHCVCLRRCRVLVLPFFSAQQVRCGDLWHFNLTAQADMVAGAA